LTFTCAYDSNTTSIAYPNATSPAYNGVALTITAVTANTFTVNVGPATGAAAGSAHTFVSAAADAVEFAFDTTACRRDVEYILDALRYDLIYGGDLETRVAAKAYYAAPNDGIPTALGAGEQTMTLAAYAQLKTIIGDYTGVSVTPSDDLIDTIIDYITDGSFTVTNANAPVVSWVESGVKTFGDKLAVPATINKLKTSVTDFVDFNFAYNEAKCRRDVGFLIDAMCYDLLYGGNVDTTQAAISYYDGAVTPKSIIPKQIIQTVAAYERLKEVLDQVVQLKDVRPSGNQFAARDRVNGSFDVLINLIKDGPNFTPKRPFLMPAPTSGSTTAFNSDYANAVKQVQANRSFLVAEVTAFINNISTQLDGALTTSATTITVDSTTNFPSAGKLIIGTEVVNYTGKTATTFTGVTRAQDGTIAGLYDAVATPPAYISWPDNTVVKLTFEYNIDKCERDVSYLIDAVLYDLTYGGNSASHLAGKAYYEGNWDPTTTTTGPTSLDGELPQSIAAYTYLGTLLEVVAQGQAYSNSSRSTKQNAVVQKTGTGGSAAAGLKAKQLITNVVIKIIDGDAGDDPAAEVPLSTSWVDSKLVALDAAIDLAGFRTAVKA
jgi:hypothetical protein